MARILRTIALKENGIKDVEMTSHRHGSKAKFKGLKRAKSKIADLQHVGGGQGKNLQPYDTGSLDEGAVYLGLS